MDFLELVKDRWSVRKFKSNQIRQEELDQILEAGKYAPTAVNFQPQKMYILKSDLAMKKINSVCKCVFGSPMAILIAVDTERAWKNPFTGHLYTDTGASGRTSFPRSFVKERRRFQNRKKEDGIWYFLIFFII